MPDDQPVVYREPLPPRCPPEDAEEIAAPLVVYRAVPALPPCDDDFRSQRAENPHKQFSADECRARGVSVFVTYEGAAKILLLPRFKTKPGVVCKINLGAGAGRIKQSGSPNHRTWWPYAAYNILAACGGAA